MDELAVRAKLAEIMEKAWVREEGWDSTREVETTITWIDTDQAVDKIVAFLKEQLNVTLT